MNNVLTASRMICLLQCPRKHYWQYEIGLQSSQSGLAQRIGSAWAVALEARWNGAKYEQALETALDDNILDVLSASIVGALLAGYYACYKKDKRDFKIKPEQEFSYGLGFGDFTVGGKRDGRGIKRDKSRILIESKTTNDSIAPDAQYWTRLKFNMQLLQYVDAEVMEHGKIPEVIYDVTRKPQIRPKEMPELDEKSLVVVRDAHGNRVYKRDGEPKASADKAKGEYIIKTLETPAQFGDRLFKDTQERPEFYFARKEVHVLEYELEMFRAQRMSIAGMIRAIRDKQTVYQNVECSPESAWPRNVLDSTCTYCQFRSFCLQNIELDLNNLPDGFTTGKFNPELSTTPQDDSTAD